MQVKLKEKPTGVKKPNDGPDPGGVKVDPAEPPQNEQLDYRMQTRAQIIRAKKIESELVNRYRQWLKLQDRKLSKLTYHRLRCDGYEVARHNLIEAKSSTAREYIRMAVGQLLDYAFQGKAMLGNPQMAVLLPNRPKEDVVAWLEALQISVIWEEKKAFLDNANGKFA